MIDDGGGEQGVTATEGKLTRKISMAPRMYMAEAKVVPR